MATTEVFALGWHEGARGAGATTAREASTLHPELSSAEVGVYLNGVEDGVRGDRWRLDRPGRLCDRVRFGDPCQVCDGAE